MPIRSLTLQSNKTFQHEFHEFRESLLTFDHKKTFKFIIAIWTFFQISQIFQYHLLKEHPIIQNKVLDMIKKTLIYSLLSFIFLGITYRIFLHKQKYINISLALSTFFFSIIQVKETGGFIQIISQNEQQSGQTISFIIVENTLIIVSIFIICLMFNSQLWRQFIIITCITTLYLKSVKTEFQMTFGYLRLVLLAIIFCLLLKQIQNRLDWIIKKFFEYNTQNKAWESFFNILTDGFLVINKHKEILYANKSCRINFMGVQETDLNDVQILQQMADKLLSRSRLKPRSTAQQALNQLLKKKEVLESSNKNQIPQQVNNEIFEDSTREYTLNKIIDLFLKYNNEKQYKIQEQNPLLFDLFFSNQIENEDIFLEKIKNDETSFEIKFQQWEAYNEDIFLIIFSDTTERNKIIELKEANLYKNRLLAQVSHELRAPLNCSATLLEDILQNEEVPENVKKDLVDPALNSCQYLLSIVNDLLDYSQIFHKKIRLSYTQFNIRDLLNSLQKMIDMQIKRKNLDFIISINGNVPSFYFSDSNRIRQIILNLVSNAIKFTNAGQIKLNVSYTEENLGMNKLKFAVSDTGIGIEEKNLKRLFKPYEKIENDNQGEINPKGVGLGLTISHSIAQILNEDSQQGIRVISHYGQGSIFWFEVTEKRPSQSNSPIQMSESVNNTEFDGEYINLEYFPQTVRQIDKLQIHGPFTKQSQNSYNSQKSLENEILIVDDSEFNIRAFMQIISHFNIEVDSVLCGLKVLQKLKYRQKHYKIIFMDYDMPIINGVELTKKIREYEQNSKQESSYIVGCTAYSGDDIKELLLRIGMDQVITKPFHASEIKSILQQKQIIFQETHKQK